MVFFPDIGISILVERCFLETNWENKLWMHDLIRKMGREIVREESVKEPGKRSRLWREEDVCHVLEKHKVTKNQTFIFLLLQIVFNCKH